MKTMKGKPITILGTALKVGDKAPEFKAITQSQEWMQLSDFKKPYVLISSVPSLDTSVCSLQTRTINEKLTSNPLIDVVTISVDLPFAQKRWCGQEGLAMTTLSDYRTVEFGLKYGLLIDDLRLLARAVFLLNKEREVIYVEYLDEMGQHPNYDKLFEFIDKNVK